MAQCPFHDDRTPSLAIYKERYHCFGCGASGDVFDWLEKTKGMSKQEALEHVAHLANVPLPPAPSTRANAPSGLTVEEYGEAKGFPIDYLQNLGLKTTRYRGQPRVSTPYKDEDASVTATRYRHALDGKGRFSWPPGAKLSLYGLERLGGIPDESITLVEGESDAQTLWLHELPALGIPGANNWNEHRDAPHLERFAKIFVVIEPDDGGEVLHKKLSQSSNS